MWKVTTSSINMGQLLLLLLLLLSASAIVRGFSVGERRPDKSEVDACGAIKDFLDPSSVRYKALVTNTNPKIIFEDDPLGQSNLMTQRLMDKLDDLAEYVDSNYGDTLVVRSSFWNPPNEQVSEFSLHYEGRAASIAMASSSDYSRLADAASAVGFDWVSRISETTVRASVLPNDCQSDVDLMFLLDGSGSVSASDFQLSLDFVENVVDFFEIGSTRTKVAFAVFATSITYQFSFNRYITKGALISAISRTPYPTGGTNTGAALDLADSYFNNIFQGARPTQDAIPRNVIIITDGLANEGSPPGPIATRLKNDGVTIFAVGVGAFDTAQLRDMASSNNHVTVLNSFLDFDGLISQISSVSCNEPAVVTPGEQTVTEVQSGDFRYFKPSCEALTDKLVIEEVDVSGKSNVYVSLTNKNPGPLDYDFKDESDDPLKLLVIPRRGFTEVFVSVQGDSDDKTLFILDIWSDIFEGLEGNSSTIVLTETQVPGITIFSPPAVKAFGGYQPEVSFRLSGTSDSDGTFAIDEVSGNVTLEEHLDFETAQSYTLQIVGADATYPCVTGARFLTVIVEDMNDHAPAFRSSVSNITVSLPEDTPPGTQVFNGYATDDDTGVNGAVTYSLDPTYPDVPFQIHRHTGWVFTSAGLDYETDQSYKLEIKAADNGSPTMSAVLQLTVDVEDIADRPPMFPNPSITISVAEDINATKSFYLLDATDADEDPLRYTVTGTDTITVDANGALFFGGPLDYESRRVYRLRATATDPSGRSATQDVTVNILDVNEPPSAVVLSNSKVPENSLPGTVVGTFFVSDPDALQTHTCLLDPAVPSGGFEIVNMQLRVASTLTPVASGIRVLIVRCMETSGTSPLSITAQIAIELEDINEAPVFIQASPQSVPEGSEPGTVAVRVVVRDADKTAKLTFEVLSPSDMFGVNNISCSQIDGLYSECTADCVLLENVVLDYETTDSYEIVLKVSDSFAASSTTNVQFRVGDLNEPPTNIFLSPVTIAENSAPGTVVGKLSSIDPDAGDDVTFALEDPTNTFETDSDGNVVLSPGNEELNHEDKSTYSITVQATDAEDLQTEAIIEISVVNVNEPPRFSQREYTTVIAESTRPGNTPLVTLRTDDDDDADTVTFSWTRNYVNTPFALDASTGEITLIGLLDYESVTSYTYGVTASDGTGLTDTAVVSIQVGNINDVIPRFASAAYLIKISRTQPVGSKVVELSVTEAEESANLEFSIDSSSNELGIFSVDNNGLVSIAVTPSSVLSFDDGSIDEIEGSPSRRRRVTEQELEVRIKVIDSVSGLEDQTTLKTVVFDGCSPNPCLPMNEDTYEGYACAEGFTQNSTACACKQGFEGPTCEDEIDECKFSNCMNGFCEDQLNGFECKCDSGWTGSRCELDATPCPPYASNPCFNNGECIPQEKGYICQCVGEFIGTRCENIDFGFLASRDGATTAGPQSEETKEAESSSSILPIIIAGAVGLLLVLAVVVYHLRNRRKKAAPTSSQDKKDALNSPNVMWELQNPMYDVHPWYHPEYSRADTEAHLRHAPFGGFLVRKHPSTPDDYLLCVKGDPIYEDPVMQTTQGVQLQVKTGVQQPRFKNLVDLVHHYTRPECEAPYHLILPDANGQYEVPAAARNSSSAGYAYARGSDSTYETAVKGPKTDGIYDNTGEQPGYKKAGHDNTVDPSEAMYDTASSGQSAAAPGKRESVYDTASDGIQLDNPYDTASTGKDTVSNDAVYDAASGGGHLTVNLPENEYHIATDGVNVADPQYDTASSAVIVEEGVYDNNEPGDSFVAEDGYGFVTNVAPAQVKKQPMGSGYEETNIYDNKPTSFTTEATYDMAASQENSDPHTLTLDRPFDKAHHHTGPKVNTDDTMYDLAGSGSNTLNDYNSPDDRRQTVWEPVGSSVADDPMYDTATSGGSSSSTVQINLPGQLYDTASA